MDDLEFTKKLDELWKGKPWPDMSGQPQWIIESNKKIKEESIGLNFNVSYQPQIVGAGVTIQCSTWVAVLPIPSDGAKVSWTNQLLTKNMVISNMRGLMEMDPIRVLKNMLQQLLMSMALSLETALKLYQVGGVQFAAVRPYNGKAVGQAQLRVVRNEHKLVDKVEMVGDSGGVILYMLKPKLH